MLILTHSQIMDLTKELARNIDKLFLQASEGEPIRVYPIPRGGVPVAYLLKAMIPELAIVDKPEDADFFVDDILDSGATMQKWCDLYPEKPFVVLIDKYAEIPNNIYAGQWIKFPWESIEDTLDDDTIVGTLRNRIQAAGAPFFANDNISEFLLKGDLEALQKEVQARATYFLKGLLIDVENDHNTAGTAKRIAKMYLHEVFKGRYLPAPKITDFPNAKGLDEMYSVGPITIRSACSHHFAPIVGKCWIGIIPGDRVIGLSKFNRIVDWVASRPQIQEEMSMQIADYIESQIHPKGLAVIVEATHMCMTWRGVKEPAESRMTNSIMRGLFRENAEARSEFLALVAKN